MNNELFSNKEKHVLAKFIEPNVTSEEDEKILNRYATIGFVHFGFNWDTMEQTATLTESGADHLYR